MNIRPIIEELGWRGIIVPAHVSRARTTCPECSRYRTKSDEPCLSVRIVSDTMATIYCHHCANMEEIAA